MVSWRDGKFKVKCTSTGGRLLEMRITGSGVNPSATTDVRPVGSVQSVGNDSFFATTGTISRGRNGYVYGCIAFNGVNAPFLANVTLRGDL